MFIRPDGSISYAFYDNHAITDDENLTLPAPEPEPDTGHEEFYGIRVYKNGDRIASHECKNRLTLNTEPLPDDHTDSDKLGEYFTG